MPVSESTPMCNFIPKYHWFPLRVWCISGSRAPARFFVDDGALMILASTIVPDCGRSCQSLCLQLAVDLLEQARPQRGRLQPVAEVEDRRLIGDRVREPEPDEALHTEILVERVLQPGVAEVLDQRNQALEPFQKPLQTSGSLLRVVVQLRERCLAHRAHLTTWSNAVPSRVGILTDHAALFRASLGVCKPESRAPS